MTLIANPIYDSVFKFLLEDERAAKILLSALLKHSPNNPSFPHIFPSNYIKTQMTADSLLQTNKKSAIICV